MLHLWQFEDKGFFFAAPEAGRRFPYSTVPFVALSRRPDKTELPTIHFPGRSCQDKQEFKPLVPQDFPSPLVSEGVVFYKKKSQHKEEVVVAADFSWTL